MPCHREEGSKWPKAGPSVELGQETASCWEHERKLGVWKVVAGDSTKQAAGES